MTMVNRPLSSAVAQCEEVDAVDKRDEDSVSDSEDESEDTDGGMDSAVERFLERVGFDPENATESDPQDLEDANQFLEDVGAMDHFDEVTSQINPSEDPSLLK